MSRQTEPQPPVLQRCPALTTTLCHHPIHGPSLSMDNERLGDNESGGGGRLNWVRDREGRQTHSQCVRAYLCVCVCEIVCTCEWNGLLLLFCVCDQFCVCLWICLHVCKAVCECVHTCVCMCRWRIVFGVCGCACMCWLKIASNSPLHLCLGDSFKRY